MGKESARRGARASARPARSSLQLVKTVARRSARRRSIKSGAQPRSKAALEAVVDALLLRERLQLERGLERRDGVDPGARVGGDAKDREAGLLRGALGDAGAGLDRVARVREADAVCGAGGEVSERARDSCRAAPGGGWVPFRPRAGRRGRAGGRTGGAGGAPARTSGRRVLWKTPWKASGPGDPARPPGKAARAASGRRGCRAALRGARRGARRAPAPRAAATRAQLIGPLGLGLPASSGAVGRVIRRDEMSWAE